MLMADACLRKSWPGNEAAISRNYHLTFYCSASGDCAGLSCLLGVWIGLFDRKCVTLRGADCGYEWRG